jgi:hypothetical protein
MNSPELLHKFEIKSDSSETSLCPLETFVELSRHVNGIGKR